MRDLLLPLALEWLALHCGPSIDVEKTLGSRHWRERQATARALEAAWPLSEATLRRAEQCRDLEVSESARVIRERCWNRAVANAPWADWPLWSVEAHGWHASRCPPLDRAIRRQLTGACGYPWENYRDLSRTWALDGLRSGWATPTLIRIWFACGRAVDSEYRQAERMPRN